jgi:hypothetical protein
MELRVSLQPAMAEALLQHCRSAHVSEQDVVDAALQRYLRQNTGDTWPDDVFDFDPLEFRFEDLREDGSLLPLKDTLLETKEKSNA